MAIREEEIRVMSAQGYSSKRSSVHSDFAAPRENKRGSRTFGRSKSDKRDSTISLPVQGTSERSSISDGNGWEFSALGFFNPRPSVRYSGIMQHSSSVPTGLGLPQHRLERLPPVSEHNTKKSRSKISDLADDFDASDLRVLMERDRRRKEKKKSADFDKLDQSLRRIRAEEERNTEGDRSSHITGLSSQVVDEPTDVHPAFRQRPAANEAARTTAAVGQPPLSPVSLKDELIKPSVVAAMAASASTEPHNDSNLTTRNPKELQESTLPSSSTDKSSEDAPPAAAFATQTLSPPQSPNRNHPAERPSPLRKEFDSSTDVAPRVPPKDRQEKDERRTSRGGAFAQFFRRGGPAKTAERPNSEMSFSNTSRESMSRQPLPAHLSATKAPDAKRHGSAVPVRKQSIFREELADSPTASPESKVKAFDATVAAANSVQATRQKPSPALATTLESTQEAPTTSQNESPIDVAMTASLASIDSEGSWLTGRHPSTRSVRKSYHSQLRSSIGSLNRHSRAEGGGNASYEDLSMTEEDLVRKPPMSPMTDAASTIGELPDRQDDEGMVTRQHTNRKTPTLVHRDPQHRSREGLVADYLAGPISPDPSRPGTAMSALMSGGSDSDRDMESSMMNGEAVEIGHGHARQLSTGSAKLLYIPASRYRGDAPEKESEQRTFTRPKSMPPL